MNQIGNNLDVCLYTELTSIWENKHYDVLLVENIDQICLGGSVG